MRFVERPTTEQIHPTFGKLRWNLLYPLGSLVVFEDILQAKQSRVLVPEIL